MGNIDMEVIQQRLRSDKLDSNNIGVRKGNGFRESSSIFHGQAAIQTKIRDIHYPFREQGVLTPDFQVSITHSIDDFAQSVRQ